MKVLFDECVPWPLQALLAENECRTAQQMRWKRIKNGQLLALAEPQFDVFSRATRTCAISKTGLAAGLRFLSSQRTSSAS